MCFDILGDFSPGGEMRERERDEGMDGWIDGMEWNIPDKIIIKMYT